MTDAYLGKTLREVKALYPMVRVVRAGDVSFRGTLDQRADRLNVEVEGPCLRYSERTLTIRGKERTFKEVDAETLDDAIVVSCRFG